MSWQLLVVKEICSFPWVKSTYIWQLAYVTFGRHYLAETSNYIVQIEIFLKNYFLFFLRQDADADFHFCLFTGKICVIKLYSFVNFPTNYFSQKDFQKLTIFITLEKSYIAILF